MTNFSNMTSQINLDKQKDNMKEVTFENAFCEFCINAVALSRTMQCKDCEESCCCGHFGCSVVDHPVFNPNVVLKLIVNEAEASHTGKKPSHHNPLESTSNKGSITMYPLVFGCTPSSPRSFFKPFESFAVTVDGCSVAFTFTFMNAPEHLICCFSLSLEVI